MVSGKNRCNTFISFGMITTFVCTALVLPIVSSGAAENQAPAHLVKSAGDTSKQNVQLSLAEKESEEEESLSKKEQNAAIGLVVDLFEQFPAWSFSFSYRPYAADGVAINPFPLYLRTRALLI